MSDETGKFLIFLSYIDEEKKIAEILKNWLEEGSLGKIEVFAFSNLESIDLGEDWHKKIMHALRNANLLIVLCSKESIVRPWINFESGAAWIKDIPIIPLCHSGMSKDSLPEPYKKKRALDFSDNNFEKTLVESIIKKIGYKEGLKIDFKQMKQEIKMAVNQVSYNKEFIDNNSLKKELIQLSKIEEDILSLLSKHPEKKIRVDQIMHVFSLENVKAQYNLDLVEKKGLIKKGSFQDMRNRKRYIAYELTQDGRKYVVENKLL